MATGSELPMTKFSTSPSEWSWRSSTRRSSARLLPVVALLLSFCIINARRATATLARDITRPRSTSEPPARRKPLHPSISGAPEGEGDKVDVLDVEGEQKKTHNDQNKKTHVGGTRSPAWAMWGFHARQMSYFCNTITGSPLNMNYYHCHWSDQTQCSGCGSEATYTRINAVNQATMSSRCRAPGTGGTHVGGCGEDCWNTWGSWGECVPNHSKVNSGSPLLRCDGTKHRTRSKTRGGCSGTQPQSTGCTLSPCRGPDDCWATWPVNFRRAFYYSAHMLDPVAYPL